LECLREGLTVETTAKRLKRAISSVYTDITKMKTETGHRTTWGVLMYAIEHGWVACPVGKHESTERPTCAE
jgi:DNA-binding NarL/FixJ family response regulator